MMKIILFPLLFFVHFSVAQCINHFEHNKAKWDNLEIKLSNNDKKNLLGNYTKIGGDYMSDSMYFSQFHPIFINSDTLIDFIFEGHSGGESLEVDILINKRNSFDSKKSDLGRILDIGRISPSSGLTICFEQYGCCDDPGNYIESWIITESNNSINISTTDKIFHLNGTKIPDCFDMNLKFEVLNKPYVLRATPEILNEPEIWHNYDRGNIIAEFGTGDTGTALASYEDETGRIWWFVVMNKPKYLDVFHNYEYYRNEQWAGWMSSRYVKVKSR